MLTVQQQELFPVLRPSYNEMLLVLSRNKFFLLFPGQARSFPPGYKQIGIYLSNEERTTIGFIREKQETVLPLQGLFEKALNAANLDNFREEFQESLTNPEKIIAAPHETTVIYPSGHRIVKRVLHALEIVKKAREQKAILMRN